MASARRPPAGGESFAPRSGSPAPDAGPDLAPRKLIRSSLAEIRREQGGGRVSTTRKGSPPEQTNAEAFYYLKQMQARTPIVVKLVDGEEVRGWIEWYDRDVLKVNRDGAPNLLIQKRSIKYLYKEEEERAQRRRMRREDRLQSRGPFGPGSPTE